MTDKKKTAVKTKPFLTGAPTDENTIKQSLKFFGALLLTGFMSFLVCSMTSFDSVILRILINIVIETLILLIYFNKGADLGTEGVSRGEILYQHIQKGQETAESEKRIPFHRAKGFLIGLFGTALFLVLAIILALTARRQMTGAGTLPSWMEAYLRRSEISDALVSYTKGTPATVPDIIRVFVRVMIMPFISMAGAENRGILLFLERISPVLILLPAISYGIGYLQGPSQRKRVHTEIAANARKRTIREKRERRNKAASGPKGPVQLN